MNQPTLYIMVGLPGSGKSTYARSIPGLIVDIDSIVTMLHGGDYGKYDKGMSPLYKAIEMGIVTSTLLSGTNVILDRCCNSSSTRQRFASIGRQLGARVVGIVMEKDIESCAHDRYNSDNRGYSYHYWQQVIEVRSELSDPICESEGFDEIVKVDME